MPTSPSPLQTYASQIKQLEVQYKRLVSSGTSLAENEFVGSRAVFSQELKDLALQWEPLKDNIMDTLEILIRSAGRGRGVALCGCPVKRCFSPSVCPNLRTWYLLKSLV